MKRSEYERGPNEFDDLRWRGGKREEIEGQFRPRNPRASNRDWITNDRVGFIFERDYSMKPIASFFSPRLSNISNRNAPTTRDRNLRLWSESWISPVSFHFLFSLSLSSASVLPLRTYHVDSRILPKKGRGKGRGVLEAHSI